MARKFQIGDIVKPEKPVIGKLGLPFIFVRRQQGRVIGYDATTLYSYHVERVKQMGGINDSYFSARELKLIKRVNKNKKK
ncbi:hypothetical protein LCGC14_2203090 [marine sediment metagenome]|uniref:Uncharacterized protein n=1 Tax=marine sediment metagenome TaxID=412755 RepID=A0A0F9FTH1_9ZZZZ